MHVYSGGQLLGDRLTVDVKELIVEDSALISVRYLTLEMIN